MKPFLCIVLLQTFCVCTAVVLAQLLHAQPPVARTPRRLTPAQVAELLIRDLETAEAR